MFNYVKQNPIASQQFVPLDSNTTRVQSTLCCTNEQVEQVLTRLDPASVKRIEDSFTNYYKQLIGRDEREQLEKSSSAIVNLEYRLSVVQLFINKCSLLLKRFMVPLLASSVPIVITIIVLYRSSSRNRRRGSKTGLQQGRTSLSPPESYWRSIVLYLCRKLLFRRKMNRREKHSIVTTPVLHELNNQHNFNLIEMLIAISILVTFSSLTSSLYHRKLYSSRVQFTKIQLHLANQALMLLFAETGAHPTNQPELEGVETRDAWNNEFIYVPYLDLDQKSTQNSANIERIAEIISIYGHAPEILYLASKGEFFFAEGPKGLIFGEEVSDQNKRYILSIIKKMREGNRLKNLVSQQTTGTASEQDTTTTESS